MRSTLARRSALALLPALGILALAGCGNEDGGSGGPGTTPSSTVVSTPAPTTPAPSTPAGTPSGPATPPKVSTPSNTADPSGETADVNIDVTIAGGKVSPSGASIKVKAGQSVKINATSDVADELHIHGYEKALELKPGKPASIIFKADTLGSFEVESHESGKLIVKLVVS